MTAGMETLAISEHDAEPHLFQRVTGQNREPFLRWIEDSQSRSSMEDAGAKTFVIHYTANRSGVPLAVSVGWLREQVLVLSGITPCVPLDVATDPLFKKHLTWLCTEVRERNDVSIVLIPDGWPSALLEMCPREVCFDTPDGDILYFCILLKGPDDDDDELDTVIKLTAEAFSPGATFLWAGPREDPYAH